MSEPAEYLHQQSLDILAKLASLHKDEEHIEASELVLRETISPPPKHDPPPQWQPSQLQPPQCQPPQSQCGSTCPLCGLMNCNHACIHSMEQLAVEKAKLTVCNNNTSNIPIASVNDKQGSDPTTTPQKKVEAVMMEPMTPETNLKMLVSAASGLEPASHVDLTSSANVRPLSCLERPLLPKETSHIYDADNESGECDKTKAEKVTGRKEKSLGLLCQKFMSIYPEYSPEGTVIMLDDVVTSLNIGRRRVYDIVNVLESMEMIVRKG